MNRQCATCTPPCQGGEVLHKKHRGYACAHSYCSCMQFTPETLPVLTEVLKPGKVHLHNRAERERRAVVI